MAGAEIVALIKEFLEMILEFLIALGIIEADTTEANNGE